MKKMNWMFPQRRGRRDFFTLKCLLVLCFFWIGSLNVWAGLQDFRVSMKVKRGTVSQILEAIEFQTPYRFVYENSAVDVTEKVSYQGENKTVQEVLDYVCDSKQLTYQIAPDDLVILKPQKASSNKKESVREETSQKVKGKVTDSQGEPLPGVTVVVKGTTSGTITDYKGEFSLEVPNTDVALQFTFIGFAKQEVSLSGKNSLSVMMREDMIGLEEVVAIGYGTQKKVNLTGSVASVSIKELDGRPITNISSALSGITSGVSIMQGSGQPGRDEATIRVRGVGTLNNADPLILVDGIESTLSDVNSNDVESISVLKDASAAAIYGSRAANGVILVTTKRGEKGKLTLSYNGYYGVQEATTLPELITNSAEYMTLANESFTNVGQKARFSDETIKQWREGNDPVLYPNTDWMDVLFRSASIQEHHVALNGGSEKMRHNFSVGYLNQDGIAIHTDYKRYSFRYSLDANVTKRLKVGGNVSGSWSKMHEPGKVKDLIHWASTSSPVCVAKAPDGRYGAAQAPGDDQQLNNPLVNAETRMREGEYHRFFGKVFAELEILKGLTWQGNAAFRYYNYLESTNTWKVDQWDFLNETIVKSKDEGTVRNSVKNYNRRDNFYTLFQTLTYDKSFGNHTIKLLGGYSEESYRMDKFSGSKENFPTDEITEIDAGEQNPQVSGTASEWGLRSYFGRANYDYKGKYLLEGNFRRDGSSRFASDHQWGTFPSFSAGWRVSEEDFMKGFVWLDNLKFRFSWGEMGNNRIDDYEFASVYSAGQNYNFGGSLSGGMAQTSFANAGITWETTTTTDFGIDLSVNQHWNFVFDYFHRLTDGVLAKLEMPATMGGLSAPRYNLAEVLNKGWELSGDYHNQIGELKFNLNANVTRVENEVTKYRGDIPKRDGVLMIKEGLPINSIVGYQCEGIFRTQEQLDQHAEQTKGSSLGDLMYKDQINPETGKPDGVINGDDEVVIGNTIPEFVYGFGGNMTWKHFDFSFLFQGVGNVDVYYQNNFVRPYAASEAGAIGTFWRDRWTPDNPNAAYPRLAHNSIFSGNFKGSDFWIQDGSYLRLKNLQLGFNLPSDLAEKMNVSKCRMYINGQNLYTWTDFWGFDPENSGKYYPNVRIVSVGLNITL